MAYSTPSSQKHTARSFLKREPVGNSADYAATVYEKGKCKVSERKSESLLCYVMCYLSHKKYCVMYVMQSGTCLVVT